MKKEYIELEKTEKISVEKVRSKKNTTVIYTYLADDEDDEQIKDVLSFLEEGMYFLFDRKYYQITNKNEIIEILSNDELIYDYDRYKEYEKIEKEEFVLYINENYLDTYDFMEFLSLDYDKLENLTLKEVFYKYFQEYRTNIVVADNGNLYLVK